MDHNRHIQPLESPREYAKFALVIAIIVGLSALLANWRGWSLEQFMGSFMAVFFITFAGFKFVSLEMFAITYSGYDLVAKKFRSWGYVFPFVELGLGLAYLVLGNHAWLNAATLVITATASVGVVKELRRKSAVMCACLGTVIKLPLSKVSFVEDFLMFAMAAAMMP